MKKFCGVLGSEEHNRMIDASVLFFSGKKILPFNGQEDFSSKKSSEKYYPDLISGNTDIECELFSDSRFKRKIKKWDEERGKILVLGIPRYAYGYFRDIYFYNESTKIFIKIK